MESLALIKARQGDILVLMTRQFIGYRLKTLIGLQSERRRLHEDDPYEPAASATGRPSGRRGMEGGADRGSKGGGGGRRVTLTLPAFRPGAGLPCLASFRTSARLDFRR